MNTRPVPERPPWPMSLLLVALCVAGLLLLSRTQAWGQVSDAQTLGTSLANNTDTVRQILVNFLQRALAGVAVVLLVLALITGFFRHQYMTAIWEGVGAVVTYIVSALINTLS